MEWEDWSRRLREVLDLDGSPVAVTYSDRPAQNAEVGKKAVCRAIPDAKEGAIFNMSQESSACPGGSWHLGLVPPPTGEIGDIIKDFIVNGEKIYSSQAALHRALTLTSAQPPLGLAKYVVFSPLEKAEFRPDLVVFLCNAWQGSRLINLAFFMDGLPIRSDPSGSLCMSAIAYPLVTGEVNLTLGDPTARKMQNYKPDELIVSIPYDKMLLVMESIDKCGAGTAKLEMSPAMQKLIGSALGP